MATLNYMKRGEESVPMELRETIATNLRHFMGLAEDEKLKKALDLAAAAGVGRRTINRLLNPQEYPKHAPRLSSLVALADILQIEPADLLVRRRKPMLSGINQHHKSEAVSLPKKAR